MESFQISSVVSDALNKTKPIVALETAVYTHGLPYPHNVDLFDSLVQTCAKEDVIPATIGMLDGKVIIGLTNNELGSILQNPEIRKLSSCDIGFAISRRFSGGTTVAGTLLCARKIGIRIMATGGIGGVHRGNPFDVSADLHELSRSPIIVVCSGAKSILDLDRTIEMLETLSVPVVGYQTDYLPGFYSVKTHIKLTMRADSPAEISEIAKTHWSIGNSSAVLVVVPPPAKHAIDYREMDTIIEHAVQKAKAEGIHGQAVTPYLLDKITNLTGKASLQVNLALLKNNTAIAAKIANNIS